VTLIFDLDQQALVYGFAQRNQIGWLSPNQVVTSLSYKRANQATINVQVRQNGVIIELPTGFDFVFGIKEVGKFDEPLVTSGSSPVKTGTGINTIYSFAFPLINTFLDGLLHVDSDSTNDIASVQLSCELELSFNGNTYKTPTIPFTLFNDIVRGFEVAVPPDYMTDDSGGITDTLIGEEDMLQMIEGG